jgi:hypothetical protein
MARGRRAADQLAGDYIDAYYTYVNPLANIPQSLGVRALRPASN